ncbi:peptidase, S54 (rhomboid) family [Hyphomonas neptunium ATCC 15444]|uniref:Peptidase, S54 (Rhomboid) family n=2 Tax=Hyphomonas TaxID=85 RepID=Q0BYV0_HYPNA|nr:MULTISPECIES: rhomboid family intramembrane serine protease [Hyphomonas]ABI77112.1 peptidase, S54 (rhomboid) family [Hyphomonas neptunium ATCC 15444]KCZ91469.1 S54 family peptidase [Hyphomonas hirschiana VP5]
MDSQIKRPPIINAPLPLTVFAVVLVVLHGLRVFAPQSFQIEVLYHGALFPERFWGWTDGQVMTPSGVPAYPGVLAALAPFVLSALLHGDWFHVILNAVFLIAIGKPVLEILTVLKGRYGAGVIATLFVLIFISQAGGGVVYLLLNNPTGAIAVGASGGLSGLMGAYFLMRDGAAARLRSRPFLTVTAIFIIANMIFAFVGPSLLGASIAWEVHVGGYIAGAVFGRLVIWDAVRKLDI